MTFHSPKIPVEQAEVPALKAKLRSIKPYETVFFTLPAKVHREHMRKRLTHAAFKLFGKDNFTVAFTVTGEHPGFTVHRHPDRSTYERK